jgi:hypothetical protein
MRAKASGSFGFMHSERREGVLMAKVGLMSIYARRVQVSPAEEKASRRHAGPPNCCSETVMDNGKRPWEMLAIPMLLVDDRQTLPMLNGPEPILQKRWETPKGRHARRTSPSPLPMVSERGVGLAARVMSGTQPPTWYSRCGAHDFVIGRSIGSDGHIDCNLLLRDPSLANHDDGAARNAPHGPLVASFRSSSTMASQES